MALSSRNANAVAHFQEMFGASLGSDTVKQVLERNYYDTDRSLQELLALADEQQQRLKAREESKRREEAEAKRGVATAQGLRHSGEREQFDRQGWRQTPQLFSQPWSASSSSSHFQSASAVGGDQSRKWGHYHQQHQHRDYVSRPFGSHRGDGGEKILFILRGLPGSGKSTLARELRGATGVVCSADDFFFSNGRYEFDVTRLGDAHEWNKNKARQAMSRGESPVVIDNTNCQRWEMKPYVSTAKRYGYKVELVEPSTSWKFDVRELARRNTHGVSADKIENMLERYEHDVTVDSILNQLGQVTLTRSRQPFPTFESDRRRGEGGSRWRSPLGRGSGSTAGQRMSSSMREHDRWMSDRRLPGREQSASRRENDESPMLFVKEDVSSEKKSSAPGLSKEIAGGGERIRADEPWRGVDIESRLYHGSSSSSARNEQVKSFPTPVETPTKKDDSGQQNDRQKLMIVGSASSSSVAEPCNALLASLSESFKGKESQAGTAVSSDEFFRMLAENVNQNSERQAVARSRSPTAPKAEEEEEEDDDNVSSNDHKEFNRLIEAALTSPQTVQEDESPERRDDEKLAKVDETTAQTTEDKRKDAAFVHANVAPSLEFLQSCFPQLTREVLLKSLQDNQYNVEDATEVLLAMQRTSGSGDDEEDDDEEPMVPGGVGGGQGSPELHEVVTDELDAAIAYSLEMEETPSAEEKKRDTSREKKDAELARKLQAQFDEEMSIGEAPQPTTPPARDDLSKTPVEVPEAVKASKKSPQQTEGIQLLMDRRFVAQLEKAFGPVPFGELQPDDYAVDLNPKFAHKLYRKWIAGLEEKYEPTELKHRRMIQKDEELARRLQEEEDRSHMERQRKREGKQRRQFGGEQKVESLKKIMHEQMTAGETERPKMESRSAFRLDKEMELATRLKRQQLYLMFPSIPPSNIDQIFCANDFALQQTIDSIKNSGIEPQQISDYPVAKAPRLAGRMPHRDGQRFDDEDADVDAAGVHGRFQVVDDEPGYEDYRAEAETYARQREESYKKAAKAFSQKQGELAQWYSQQGKLYTKKMEEANKRASLLILRRTNENRGSETLDLHGLHVKEAIEALEDALARLRMSNKRGTKSSRRRRHLIVVTGRGVHSEGGRAKIKPAVESYLRQHRFKYTVSVGHIEVSL